MSLPRRDGADPDCILAEQAAYFAVEDASLYTVRHPVSNPVARMLLVGPFASERHPSYRTWVRWARYLAAMKIEVLRYDYRGIGESTGVFEKMTLDSWLSDVVCLSAWLRGEGRQLPLILHGLELGGLLAARAFDEGAADALILWSVPENANKVLRSTLQRWLGPQQLLRLEGQRKLPKDYFHRLDTGQSVEVEGYEWTADLWRQSLSLTLPAAMVSSEQATRYYQKPVRMVSLGQNARPLARGGVPGFEENKDFEWLFAQLAIGSSPASTPHRSPHDAKKS